MLCVGATLIVGCHELTAEARQELSDGAHAYELGRYSASKATLTRFIQQHPDAPETGEAYYLRGLCHLKLRQRSEAQRDFTDAITKSPRKDVSLRAQAALGVMAYDDGHWAAAIRHYEDAIFWLEDLREYDDQLLRYGISLQRMGQWDQSARLFSQILHDYPKGSAAKAARRMLGWNKNYFTVQCHALSKSAAADKEVARLRGLGLKASRRLDTRGGRAWYLVQVGEYRTYDEAKRAERRIRRLADVPLAKVVP